MGEAKAIKLARAARLLAEIDLICQPQSDDVIAMISAVQRLSSMKVERSPASQLNYMRMKPNECHQNCAAFVRLDPEKLSETVHGWWRHGGSFCLHSVIKRQGKLFCVTPARIPDTGWLDFTPDTMIVAALNEDGTQYRFSRDGTNVPRHLIVDFEATVRDLSSVRKQLLKGADPAQFVGRMALI